MRHALILVTIVVACARGASAAELSFSRNARTIEGEYSTLVTKSMAHACLTSTMIPDGLPCNPANTTFTTRSGLGLQLLVSNGYANLSNVQSLVDGKVTQDLIDKLFSSGRIIQIEANADIYFRSKHFGGRYTPLSMKGFSVVRNEASPDIEVSVLEEKGFTFQTGYEVFNDFHAGIQTRFVNRRFVKRRFKLTELGVPGGTELLKPKEQTATLIEPGATWFLGQAWRPRVSVLLANAGFVSQEHDELKIPLQAQFGLGIAPPVGWGELELSVEFRNLGAESRNAADALRAGGLYRFGSMYLSGGLDMQGVSGGVFYAIERLNAGIMYATTNFINSEETFFTQTVYVQLGWQL